MRIFTSRTFPATTACFLAGLCSLTICALPATLAAQTATGAPPAPAVSTLHASARLVVVDVVVTDAQGNSVHGLPKSAFHVSESGKPQTIGSFEEHSAIPGATRTASLPPLQPGVFTNVASTGDSALNVLLLDRINTPVQYQVFVRQQLLNYLKTAKPNSRITIFGLNSRLVMLQGFTSDPEILRRAMEQSNSQAPALTEGKEVGAGADVIADQISGIEAQLSISPQMAQAIGEMDAVDTNINENLSVDATLHAFNQLARYLAGFPGRKNLMWFSASFPLNLMPRPTMGNDPFAGTPPWKAEYLETIALLASSHVAVYPIDARGLMPASLPTSGYTGRAQRTFSTNMFESQSSMYEMAEDTGGKAYTNTNGLAEAVQSVVDSGSNYYTLSYTPPPAKQDEYRKIHVELEGKNDYKLAFRHGYYADSTAPPASTPPRNAIAAASLFTAPPAMQIPFFARVLPLSATAADVVAPGDASHPQRALDNPLSVRYSIEYSAEPRWVSASPGDDSLRHAHLEFIALAYDAQGKIISTDVKPVRITWTPAQFEAAQQHGLRYQQQLSVAPQHGYSLRLLIHDLLTDRIGSIDVPLNSLQTQAPAH